MSDPYSLHHCLKLIRTRNIGVTRFMALTEEFGSPGKALAMLPELAKNKQIKFSFEIPSDSQIEREIEATQKQGAHFIHLFDDRYPEELKHITDPPPILIAKGNLELLNKPKIALIGSRNASLNGRTLAGKIAKELGENDFITVSGLARGIDGAIHEASINTGTIGVIAGGIDHIYPSEHKKLFHDLFEHGLVLTEMPLGTTAKAQDFPRRNRIVAGLSLGTVVIEAALKSGSLITARLANEYGRDVFAIPGSPLDPRSQGGNKLIQNGAKLIQSTEDILEELALAKKIKPVTTQPKFDFEPEAPLNEKKNAPEVKDSQPIDNIILNELDNQPIETDLIIRTITAQNTRLEASEILQKIQKLELMGDIHRHAGNKISKA